MQESGIVFAMGWVKGKTGELLFGIGFQFYKMKEHNFLYISLDATQLAPITALKTCDAI